MQYCAALCKSYPHLGTPTQAALFYGEISQDFFNELTDEGRMLLDFLTSVEYNERQIEAMKEQQKKQQEQREEEQRFPAISSKMSMDEVQARVDEHKRLRQGEF